MALLALIAGAFLTQRTQNLLASTFDESAKPSLTEAEVVTEAAQTEPAQDGTPDPQESFERTEQVDQEVPT